MMYSVFLTHLIEIICSSRYALYIFDFRTVYHFIPYFQFHYRIIFICSFIDIKSTQQTYPENILNIKSFGKAIIIHSHSLESYLLQDL